MNLNYKPKILNKTRIRVFDNNFLLKWFGINVFVYSIIGFLCPSFFTH